ncbi:MAG: hypothetical protein AMJ94_06845, partial [Deltaproteobacteria bacterium SM23_61]
IQRDIRELKGDSILVNVHPNVANYLYDEVRLELEKLEKRYTKRITITGKNDFHLEQYEIQSQNGHFPVDKSKPEIIASEIDL